MALSKKVLLALLPYLSLTSTQATSGTGTTTRYWDCCKASCGWTGKASFSTGPVLSCNINDQSLGTVGFNTQSGCDGGTAYMCSDQTPWAVSDSLAYGFAATVISGGSESTWCCACYQLTFTSGPVAGKTMIVQATNTGGDLAANQFDIAMPGGGFGAFDGCVPEWGTPAEGWGAQFGGISERSMCDDFPAPLQAGCYWRFDWFMNANNPTVSWQQVTCPAAITDKSGCVRSGEVPTGPSVVPTVTVTGSGSGTAPTSTSNPPTTVSPPAPSGTVALFGQCGGQGYTGPTQCVAPATCQELNPFFFQCLD